MQIASFILVSDRVMRRFEDQMEMAVKQAGSSNVLFTGALQSHLQELGAEHPISIPMISLFPLDQAAGRQHAQLLSTFEDPGHPSRLRRIAEAANVPIFYVSPGRVREFARELVSLHLASQLHPEDVQMLLGKRISRAELPAAVQLIEQFRRDLHQVYHDAANEGKGVIVVVVSEPGNIDSEDEFPRAA